MYQNNKHHQPKNASKKGNNNNNNNDSMAKTLNSNTISEDKRIKLEAKRKLGMNALNSPYCPTSPASFHQEQQQQHQQPHNMKSPGSSNYCSYQVKPPMNNSSSLSRQKQNQQQEYKPLFSQKEFPALESTCHSHSMSHPHSHSHSNESSSSTLKKSSNNASKANSPKEHGKLKEKPKDEPSDKNEGGNQDTTAPAQPILDHWQMVYTACRKLFYLDEEKDADGGDGAVSLDCHCPSCIDETNNSEMSKEQETQNQDESNDEDLKKQEPLEPVETPCHHQNVTRDYDFEDWDLICDSRNCVKKEWHNSDDEEDDTTLENNEDDNDDNSDYEWIIIADKQIQCAMSDDEETDECLQQYNVF